MRFSINSQVSITFNVNGLAELTSTTSSLSVVFAFLILSRLFDDFCFDFSTSAF